MPNIFKHFCSPRVSKYSFPPAQEIELPSAPQPSLKPEDDQEPELSAQEQPPEEETPAQPGPDPSQGAAAMFSYARVQADAIVAQAKRQGEQMLEEYRQQASEQASQVLEQAHEEGYRQGYADGLLKAQAESRAAQAEQLAAQAGQLQQFLEKAEQQRESFLEKAQDELCDLSIAVAEKVIHVSLKSSREVILRMVQMATERLRRREWVQIYIGGCDTKQLAQISPELTASLSGLSDHIKLIPMPNDESGTCIIEMPDQIIDASASTQLENIREILHRG